MLCMTTNSNAWDMQHTDETKYAMAVQAQLIATKFIFFNKSVVTKLFLSPEFKLWVVGGTT